VLTALEDGPRPLIDLRRAAGSPPQTTMRVHLKALTDSGVLLRRRQSDFPGSVDLELGPAGRELLEVARVLEAWLACSPEGPLELGSPAAKSVTKALVEAWSSNIVRALSAKAFSLTELSKLISTINYPSLERRLAAMRLSNLIESCPGGGRARPYLVSRWMRQAIAPLTAAASWERRHLPLETPAIGRIDFEAAFLLSVPLLALPSDVSGACRLAVEVRSATGEETGLAGVLIGLDSGSVTSCSSNLRGQASAWAVGSSRAWMGAVIDGDVSGLELGGDSELSTAVLDGLHETLYGARQSA
jgi:DNA-binding HxlR family transcriptional regulator